MWRCEEVRTTLSGMPDFCAQAGVSERRMEELVQGKRLP